MPGRERHCVIMQRTVLADAARGDGSAGGGAWRAAAAPASAGGVRGRRPSTLVCAAATAASMLSSVLLHSCCSSVQMLKKLDARQRTRSGGSPIQGHVRQQDSNPRVPRGAKSRGLCFHSDIRPTRLPPPAAAVAAPTLIITPNSNCETLAVSNKWQPWQPPGPLLPSIVGLFRPPSGHPQPDEQPLHL